MTDVRVVTTEAAITGETEVRSITVFTFSGTVTASGGGSGAVDSVNSQTGTVVLDAADVGALPDTTVIPDSPGDIGAATAAQGALADSAVQPGDLSLVATSGDYDDLSGVPTLGTAAAANAGDFDPAGAADAAQAAAIAADPQPSNGNPVSLGTASPGNQTVYARGNHVHPMPSASDVGAATTAQGATADTAVQPGDLSTVATTGAYADLTGKPTIPSTASDVGAVPTTRTVNGHALSADVTVTAADVSAPPTTRTVSAGTGLTGGGDLSANRTLAADFGTGAGKVTQGNDSRLSDARTPTAHASSHAAAGSDPVTLGAAQIGSGTVATARLGSGTASSSTFLRGDQTWATPAGGSGSVATDTIFDAKGDLAVGTGSDTAAKLTVGSNGQALIADSSQTTGLKYASPTSVLAVVSYSPGSLSSYTVTATSATDVDATNLAVTFAAPTSGNIVVTLSADAGWSGASGSYIWGVRNGTTTLATQAMGNNSGTVNVRLTSTLYITGLTPGNSYTLKWAWYVSASGTARIFAGGGDAAGPAVMKVETAP